MWGGRNRLTGSAELVVIRAARRVGGASGEAPWDLPSFSPRPSVFVFALRWMVFCSNKNLSVAFSKFCTYLKEDEDGESYALSQLPRFLLAAPHS